ncbi:MAG: diguanylate cyclase domain-containing protein, partial [Curvibacter sp.]
MNQKAEAGTNHKLQQTLLEYQAILENAPVGILVSRDLKVVSCTPRFSEIFGWSHRELVGQPAEVLYPDRADYEALGREAIPVLGRGDLLDIEWTMRHKDGRALRCHMRARAINPQNTAVGTIWIIEDVTQRHRDREQLQELLQRQQAILENALVGILFTREGRIVQCNPRMEDIMGWPKGMLEGQSEGVFFESDDDYAAFRAMVGQGLGAGELLDVEWLNTRHDGSKVWCRHLAKALPTRDGSRSTIWIVQDIKAQKDAQAALQQAHQELEERVEERTLELAFMNNELQNEIVERAEVERHLRAQEARFRDLSELSSDWFWEMDASLRFTEMSGGLYNTRLDPRRTIGKQRWELPIVGVSAEQWAEHRALLQARQPFRNFVFQMQTEPGQLRWFCVSGKPVFEDGVFTGYRGIGSDITNHRHAEQKIEFLAYHDPLTGLPNRVLLQDRLNQAIAQAERSRTGVALVFMDLDNFKNVNDSLGHAAGDALLGEVARRLRACVRDSDTISRQGGDEFVLILRELHGGESSLPVLTKVMEALQEPYLYEGNELSTSASIGIALYPEDGSDFEALSKKADMAMYRAKEAGRNTHRFFDEAMDQEAVEHLVMRSGLRRALEREEFTLHYQPQLEIASGRVIGVEALLRWRHPEFGLVAPGRFIPVAEESGLIVPIGAWVIQEACRQAAAWRQSGLAGLMMAVNLSAAQFRREGIEETVTRA